MRLLTGKCLVFPGALLHAALLLLPAAACGRLPRCLADPAVAAFLILATMLYAADAVKDWRIGAEQPAWDAAAAASGQETLHRLALLTGLALLAAFWVALVSRVGRASPAMGWRQAAGAAVMLAGAILRWLAVSRLGRFFVTPIRVAADQPLVCDGIYRILRHPSETGILAAALGASVLLGSLTAAIVWAAVILPLVVVRVRGEDRFLQRAFGKPYLCYQSRTGGLLPKLPRLTGRSVSCTPIPR
jgi:protein-S-isoprenylcysteine O-methyltransferase Ste14